MTLWHVVNEGNLLWWLEQIIEFPSQLLCQNYLLAKLNNDYHVIFIDLDLKNPKNPTMIYVILYFVKSTITTCTVRMWKFVW